MATKHKKTRFLLDAPDAAQVCVAGTFNDWRDDATPLTRGPDGVWQGEVDLAPGCHEYKYVVDGIWCCEIGANGPCEQGGDGSVPNPFGTHNRVLKVRY